MNEWAWNEGYEARVIYLFTFFFDFFYDLGTVVLYRKLHFNHIITLLSAATVESQ
jgi:hypothetical protein